MRRAGPAAARRFSCAAFPRGSLYAMTTTFRAVLSPCIGVCMLDDDGICLGCHRTSGEIARWPQMGDDERLRLMETVLPHREAERCR
jgi:uncharacterized protein